jgi:hypothetical protein
MGTLSVKVASLSSIRDKVRIIDELGQHYPFDQLLLIAQIPRSTFYYQKLSATVPGGVSMDAPLRQMICTGTFWSEGHVVC